MKLEELQEGSRRDRWMQSQGRPDQESDARDRVKRAIEDLLYNDQEGDWRGFAGEFYSSPWEGVPSPDQQIIADRFEAYENEVGQTEAELNYDEIWEEIEKTFKDAVGSESSYAAD